MTRINLLPAEERSRAAREQGLLLVIVGLIVLVVALGAVYFLSVRQVSSKQSQVNDTAAQIDVANVRLAALRPYETLQVQRQAMTLTAAQILNARVSMSNLLEEISLLLPSGVSLQSLTVTLPPYMIAGASDSSSAAASTTLSSDVTMAGTATAGTLYAAHDQVAALLTQLGLMPQIMNMKLASSTAATAGASVSFTISASLRPFATTPPLAPAAPSITMGGGQ
jgi:Tfp pilus assembly protein PilN